MVVEGNEEVLGEEQATDAASVAAEVVEGQEGQDIDALPEGELSDPPAYEPNYTYKVLGEQKEFPEQVRDYIKDEETEKYFKDLYERADGINHVKAHRDEMETELKTIREQQEQVLPYAQKAYQAEQLLQNGKVDQFFNMLGVTDDQLFQHALKKLQLKDNPEQYNMYNQNVAAQQQEMVYQNQIQQQQQLIEQQATRQREFELDSHLSRPELQELVQTYDSRAGTPGSFRKAVIDRGLYHWQMQQVDKPVNELVDEIAGFIRPVMTPPAAAQPQASTGETVVKPRQRVATMGNNRATGGSPVKSQVRSVDDLRKIGRQKGVYDRTA